MSLETLKSKDYTLTFNTGRTQIMQNVVNQKTYDFG